MGFVPDFSAQIRAFLPFDNGAGLFVVGLIYFIVAYLVLRGLAYVGLRVAYRLTARTTTTFDDTILDTAGSVVNPSAIVLAAYLAIAMLAPESSLFGYSAHDTFVMAAIALGAYIAQRFVRAVIKWYEKELLPAGKLKRKELFSFMINIISVFIYATAAMIILSRLGIEIGPLLAGLGIAGLAVALALQDSLSNLFAGIHILADKPFKVGDFIVVNNDDKKKGWVDEIGWRSTRIRFPDNNMLIVPNAKLASSEILNSSLPSPPMAIVFTVGASYADKPDKVIKTIERVVDRVLNSHPDAVKDFKIVRLSDFKDSSIEYVIVVRVKEYMAQYGVVGEMKRQIYYEFEKEGISIPFPQRDVHVFGERPKRKGKGG